MYELTSDSLVKLACVIAAVKKCIDTASICAVYEVDEESPVVAIYPGYDRENYLKVYTNDDDEIRVCVYAGGRRVGCIDPEEYGYDIHKMLARGRVLNEYKCAVNDVMDRICAIAADIHAQYGISSSRIALGIAFDRFVLHECESIWNDSENKRLYFDVRGEALAEDASYCLDYGKKTLNVVDKNDKDAVVMRGAYDLALAFENEQ